MIEVTKNENIFTIDQDGKGVLVDTNEVESLIIYFSNNIEMRFVKMGNVEFTYCTNFDKCKNTRIKEIIFGSGFNCIKFYDGVFIHSIEVDGVVKYYDNSFNECSERI